MPPPAVPHGMCLKVIDNRNMKGGMGSETNPLKFMNQDYNILQEYYLKKGRGFEDEFFPPDPRSIGEGLLDPEDMARVKWIRPTKLCPDAAEFIVESVSRFDYSQGIVGNCWFLASVGALTFQSKFLQKVMPDGQSFSRNYTGLFHFRFWRFGNWYDVVIDDKLPIIDNQLIFVQSKTFNEFWPALMEKAYAKLCGSYADMHAGRVSEALMDFTGGVHIHYDLKTAPTDLWEIMYRAFQSEVLMGCETPQGKKSEEELPNGIIQGHAYTVTNVYQVMSGRYPVKLVRLFNPWGKKEWNGDWSDGSPLWNTVSNEDRKQHLLDDNGEFWMSMEDFLRTFDNIDICCSYPDFLEGKSASRWTSKYHNGSWVIGSTAGGCTNHQDTFCTNPQFWLKVNEMDKACEQGQSNVLVSLIQKPDKRNRRLAAHHGIGFCVYAMRSEGKLGSSFFFSRYPVARSEKFEAARQVMSFFRLEPGEYVIVPSTFYPNEHGEFILSILCKNEIHIQKDTERTENFLVDLVGESEYKVVDAEKLQQILHENLLKGMHLNEDILNLMFVRYGGASEQISLEGFICLVMRLNCMAKIQTDFKMPPPAVPHGMCLKVIDDRNMKGGMGSETNPLKFMDQDYKFLQDYCLKTRQRFVDEFFPPDPHSIGEGLLKPEVMARVEWMRPSKLYPDAAEFIVESVSRFDYSQGNIGNCWFLASVGALTFQSKLLHKVIPDGQSFSNNYTGLFHFRFWRFGKWYDVVIDDKLPTINRQLIFVKSKTFNEFWPALLEKAYAKVCGSYADMHTGRVSEALMDFTGGVHMHFGLKTAPTDLWEIMYRAFQSEVLMGCETPQGNHNEERLPNGIVLGHAYTVTKVYQVTSGRYPVQLVRLFNPWGDSEWNGDWSDKSPLWNTVSDEDRKQHLLNENGEFWMSIKDFLRTFDNMDICCSCPDFLEGTSACHWISKSHNGSWVIGSTAGGCMNHLDTFCTNPQFWLKVNEMDKACEQGQNNVLVSLIQKPDKRNRRLAAHHGIGFCVYAMRSEGKLGSSFFYSRKPVAASGDFQDARQVMSFFRLEPGEYLIVPSTYSPNKNAEFILSILCKNELHIQKDTERTEKDFLVDFVGESEAGYTEQVDEGLKDKTLFRQYSDQNIFYTMDSSKDGVLSLSELQNALEKTGMHLNEDILNLMFVRYGGASEQISLEGFICLVMRLNCMASE
ncbi:Calpain-8 [Anabarilius grahami]|uniref:Calpain-8 n=1 Tax=Anabarilius grahami TaxID=495550 RepID=A0A3N0Z042_ANAGA|nr:Calpain-8 [Anabarilius grahami]